MIWPLLILFTVFVLYTAAIIKVKSRIYSHCQHNTTTLQQPHVFNVFYSEIKKTLYTIT